MIKLDSSLRHSAWEEFSFFRASSDSCYEKCGERAVAKTNQPFVSHLVNIEKCTVTIAGNFRCFTENPETENRPHENLYI